MTLRTVACLLLALAVMPATAGADGRIERAQQIAAKVWNDPCAGNVRIEFGMLRPASYTTGAAWAWQEDCLIQFHDLPEYMPWYKLCDTLIHEYGHLAGLGHSTNPRSVMFADTVFREELTRATASRRWVFRVRGADRRCYDRGRRYLGMRHTRQGWR